MTRKIKVGIIQQANTKDLRTNLMNLAKSIEACAAHGAQLVVLQELHNSLYSVRRKTRSCSTWQNRFPVLLRDSIQSWLLPTILCWSLLCSRNALPDCIITQRLFLNVTAALPGNTGRCIFLMTPPIMRNSILLPVI